MAVNHLQSKERIPQLDYLKGVFILLMVIFHLALVEQTYPLLCKAVYTFHMSAFLIISGYLANVDKKLAKFGHDLLRLAVPYVLFESLYIIAQYYIGGQLGAHNAIDQLTARDFVVRVATLPTGPYWYIHTLVISTIVYWLVYKALKQKGISGLALTALILFGLTVLIEGLTWSNVIYFVIGIFIYRSGNSFSNTITPSFVAALPLIVLFWFPENYDNGTLAGIAITVLVISLLLALYSYCPHALKNALAYLGRNSLAIVLFSPIFTIATKKLAPLFSFDPTTLSFLIVALAIVMTGCLAGAYLCDKLHLSRIIFLKNRFYSPYSRI